MCCNIPGSKYKYISNEEEPKITGKIIEKVIMDECTEEDSYDNDSIDLVFNVTTTDGTRVTMSVYNKNNNGYYNNDVVYTLIQNDKIVMEYSSI